MSEPREPIQEPVRETVREERVVDRPMGTVVEPVPAYNYRAVQAVWFITGLIDVLLIIRFVLKLLGASTSSGFVTFMYNITAPLVAPFQGIFGTPAANGSVLEPATLVAIVVYSLIGWGIVALIRLLTAPKGTRPVR
ncbi:MAG: YggT family protein [Candidatus Dormibacteraeota bacterium]|nr:YggT family protein [Candidatus Dormibacteraeota bacterium]